MDQTLVIELEAILNLSLETGLLINNLYIFKQFDCLTIINKCTYKKIAEHIRYYVLRSILVVSVLG